MGRNTRSTPWTDSGSLVEEVHHRFPAFFLKQQLHNSDYLGLITQLEHTATLHHTRIFSHETHLLYARTRT